VTLNACSRLLQVKNKKSGSQVCVLILIEVFCFKQVHNETFGTNADHSSLTISDTSFVFAYLSLLYHNVCSQPYLLHFSVIVPLSAFQTVHRSLNLKYAQSVNFLSDIICNAACSDLLPFSDHITYVISRC